MDVSVFFRNVETLTLRRDTILRRFRRQLRDYMKNRVDIDTLKDTLRSLRRSRRALTKLLKEFKSRDLDSTYKEHVRTLVEFTLLIAVSEETELLTRLHIILKRRGVGDEGLMNELNSDLEEVKELGRVATEFLNGIR